MPFISTVSSDNFNRYPEYISSKSTASDKCSLKISIKLLIFSSVCPKSPAYSTKASSTNSFKASFFFSPVSILFRTSSIILSKLRIANLYVPLLLNTSNSPVLLFSSIIFCISASFRIDSLSIIFFVLYFPSSMVLHSSGVAVRI